MRLKKAAGGTSIGPHHWEHDGSVVEVPDDLGRELLRIPESGFERVDKDKDDEDGEEFSEVVPVGYTRGEDAPSTPGDGGEVPDGLGDRSAYRVTEDGAETVPPDHAPSGEHPRVEEPGDGRTGVKDVDRATDADRAGHEGKHEARRDDEPKRRGSTRKPAAE